MDLGVSMDIDMVLGIAMSVSGRAMVLAIGMSMGIDINMGSDCHIDLWKCHDVRGHHVELHQEHGIGDCLIDLQWEHGIRGHPVHIVPVYGISQSPHRPLAQALEVALLT